MAILWGLSWLSPFNTIVFLGQNRIVAPYRVHQKNIQSYSEERGKKYDDLFELALPVQMAQKALFQISRQGPLKKNVGIFCNVFPSGHYLVDKRRKLHKFRAQIATGGVAQLVRACGSYPQSHWFKSSHRHQQKTSPALTFSRPILFFLC